jgi:hypothetical protein
VTKAEQLQRAIDWIIDNKMEDKFCTVSIWDDKPRLSFLHLHEMIEVFQGKKAEVRRTSLDGSLLVSLEVDGIGFTCFYRSHENIAPGTYTLDESLLKAELVG